MWDNGGLKDVGAVTWCHGSTGCTGPVSPSNSLVGQTLNDAVGSEVEALTNGNYVVATINWDNGPLQDAGAATWCDGAAGCSGTISSANSLVGTTVSDQVGRNGLVALSNGNYVVSSELWSATDLGAVTWCSGTAGCTGAVSAANSLVGTTASDFVGFAEPLSDGNYVVFNGSWDNGAITDAGAVTLARGDTGTVDAIHGGNSVRGTLANSGGTFTAGYNALTGQLVVGRSAENMISLFTYRGPDITVTTTDDHDDGNCSAEDCTLREAIVAANLLPDDSIIGFAPGVSGIIQLTGRLPDLASNLTVQGPGADLLTVRRNSVGIYRIFSISNGMNNGPVVSITGLTISNGQATSDGGGIQNDHGTVLVRDCVLTGNSSMLSDPTYGGAIFNWNGRLTIENSTLTGNTATYGGGVGNVRRSPGTSSVTIRNSTLNNNTAVKGDGGGIYNEATNSGSFTQLYLSNSTLSSNSATPNGFLGGAGGALYNYGSLSGHARAVLQDCTLSGNQAANTGGIYNRSFSANASLALRNTILKTDASGGNLLNADGMIISLGHNLSNDAAAGPNGTGPGGHLNAPGDIRNTDPLLGPLQDNGGPTFTHALLNGSPAINRGADTGDSMIDQRGFARVQASDIGAFEFGAAAPTPTPSPSPSPSPTPQPSSTPTPTPNPSATPTPTPVPGQLANISTRLRVETGENVLIGGFIVTGTQPKKVIVRAIGPSLPFADRLENPTLELYGPNGLIESNDNWLDSPNKQAIIDSTIPPTSDLESAIVATLPANSTAYTAIVRGVGNGTGIGVVEAYDLETGVDSKLANISTRGLVQTGQNVLIAGTIVIGQVPQKIIIRAIGPSLPVAGNLVDPILELRDSNGGLVEANDNWIDSPNKQAIIDSTIPPTNDVESAIVATLPANNAAYTAIVRGVNDTTGIAVVEVYALN